MALFSPETWPFSLDLLPDDAYLVGGSVRDRLLQRSATYLDLDFVLSSNVVKTAATIANAYDAGFVVLDEARQIARVVFAEMTVDFAQQQGETIAIDLQRRDFTINAIAYHLSTQQLIDPLGGKTDIAHKILRMVSYENLAADPLRLMRGYRQAAQLEFTLSADTQSAIRQLAPLLAAVSGERVHSELDALLSIPAGSDYLASMLENRLLWFCLPHFDGDRVEQIKAVDGAIAQLQSQMPAYAQHLKGWLKPVPAGHYRSWIKAVKLSRMVGTKPKQAEAELVNLKYSRSEIQAVITLLEAQSDIDAMLRGQFTQAQQFFLFKAAGDGFPAVSLLALAQGVSLSLLQPMIERFLNPEDAIAHAQTLITGKVLMKQLKLTPGPQIGQILKAVEQAQAEGQVNDQASAIAFVQQWQDLS